MFQETTGDCGLGSKQSRMSSVQTLKQFVNDRLAAAAQEIFGVFQLTVSELESELVRHRALLDVLLKQPVVCLPNIDVQQLQVTTQEDSPEQECSLSLDLEEPEPPHNEDEKQENNALVQVNSADEVQMKEEPSTSSFTQHIKTADTDNCGGSEPASYLDSPLHPDHQMSVLSESDTDNSEDWRETSNTQPGSNSVENPKVHVSEKKDDTDHKSLICSGCEGKYSTNTGLTFCGNCFEKRPEINMKTHTGENPLTCSQCRKCFKHRRNLKEHMRIHTGEKPFSCPHCHKSFTQSGNMQTHMRVHTGEKPYSCSHCDKSFTRSGNLQVHMLIHTGRKPYSCSNCGKCFAHREYLHKHVKIHT